MIALNASCNFLVYLLFSSHFRAQIMDAITALQLGAQQVARTVVVPLIHLHAIPRHPAFTSRTGELSISVADDTVWEPSTTV